MPRFKFLSKQNRVERRKKTLVDSDEVLEEYLVLAQQKATKTFGSKTVESRPFGNLTSEIVNSTNESSKDTQSSNMAPSGYKTGFLPIAMPKPDPPDFKKKVIQCDVTDVTDFDAPCHIEVRSTSSVGDDVATEVSDVTSYTTEFVSEELTFGEKRSRTSKLRKYQSMLHEKKTRRNGMRSSFDRLQKVSEEKGSVSTSKSSEIENEQVPIDVTDMEENDDAQINDIVDLTDMDTVCDARSIARRKKQVPVIIDTTAYEESSYKPSSEISAARKGHAKVEEKAIRLIQKPAKKDPPKDKTAKLEPLSDVTKQEPPGDVSASSANIVGPPTPRLKSPRKPRSKPHPEDSKSSELNSNDSPASDTRLRNRSKYRQLSPSISPKNPPEEKSSSIYNPKALSSQVRSPHLSKSTPPVSPKSPQEKSSSIYTPTALSSPVRSLRLAKSSTPASQTGSGNRAKSLLQLSRGNENPTLLIKETVSASGSVVIDTTAIDDDDLEVMNMLKADKKDGEKQNVFSFISSCGAYNRDPDGVAADIAETPETDSGIVCSSDDRNPETASQESRSTPQETPSQETPLQETPALQEEQEKTSASSPNTPKAATRAVNDEATAAAARAAGLDGDTRADEVSFSEFVSFTAGCIQSFATSVNSKVQETLQEIPQIDLDLISDKDMDGMLGALEKGMSERTFVVPPEERETLSSFFDEHVVQPAKNKSSDAPIPRFISSVKQTYKKSFVECGVTVPKTQDKSNITQTGSPKVYAAPIGKDYRFRQIYKQTRE